MRDGRQCKVDVRADGEGLVSHAGSWLLACAADRVGLTRALSDGLGGLGQRRSGHDPGRVVRDLVVMLADGGDCLADLGALGDQDALFGPVASSSTAFRVVDQISRDPDLLCALRDARAAARSRAWELGARPSEVVIDIDATLITSHSDKEGAAGNYKGGFGFHPLLAYLDGNHEALAGQLRPGNAGANTAADHVMVADDALAQLPAGVLDDPDSEILVRADSAGATHEFLADVAAKGLRFSVGLDLTENVREAILALPESAFRAAVDQDGNAREGAWVAEITDRLDLAAWPAGSRVIVRRERPHPGAQLTFQDHDGHRFQATLTNQPGTDLASLERRHRAHARVEDRIRTAKQTGLNNLPFRAFDHNAVWLELVLTAQDLIAHTQNLLLTGELVRAEPKRLRYRLLHTAARLAFHARTATLKLQADWPWAGELAAAFARLAALPAPAR